MYKRAFDAVQERLKIVTKWDDFVPTLDAKSVVVMPWCEVESCEDDIKERSGKSYVFIFHPLPSNFPGAQLIHTYHPSTIALNQLMSELPLPVLNR